MKIAVAMASRGRPMGLIGSIMSLWRLRSGKHDVLFRVGLDEDDEASHQATFDEAEFPEGVIGAVVKPRSPWRGARENDAIALCEGADVVSIMSDRTFCITPGWDDVLARATIQMPKRVLWWSSPGDGGCVVPAVPRAYLEANGGKWSPEIFPFWHDDTWNVEIDVLLHGLPCQKVTASYAGWRGQTQSARDFAFWQDFFARTRPMRRAQAEVLGKILGFPVTQRPDVEAYFANFDASMNQRSAAFQDRFGDRSEPSPEYEIAKARAEKMLAEL